MKRTIADVILGLGLIVGLASPPVGAQPMSQNPRDTIQSTVVEDTNKGPDPWVGYIVTALICFAAMFAVGKSARR